MRKLNLKTNPRVPGFDYAKIIESSLNNPTKEGFNISQIRQASKILDKVEDALKDGGSKTIDLTDEEFKILKDCFDRTQWIVPDKILIEFDDDLNA